MPLPRDVGAVARWSTAAQTRERLRRLDATSDQLDDRTYLSRLYGFFAPVERALAMVEIELAEAKLRIHKHALLALDLVSLGIDPRALAAMPTPTLGEPVGWLYILETTTLAARRRRDDSTFARCYGRSADRRWRELATAIDDYAARSGKTDSIHLEGWLGTAHACRHVSGACPACPAAGRTTVRWGHSVGK